MEDLYVHKASLDNYDEYVGYMKDPKAKFDQYVEERKNELIVNKLRAGIVPGYKYDIRENLKAFRHRLLVFK